MFAEALVHVKETLDMFVECSIHSVILFGMYNLKYL